jgi:hypothetical protein
MICGCSGKISDFWVDVMIIASAPGDVMAYREPLDKEFPILGGGLESNDLSDQ